MHVRYTPLIQAARANNVPMLKLLVDLGASTKAVDTETGLNALGCASDFETYLLSSS